jgi:hypothetical protein
MSVTRTDGSSSRYIGKESIKFLGFPEPALLPLAALAGLALSNHAVFVAGRLRRRYRRSCRVEAMVRTSRVDRSRLRHGGSGSGRVGGRKIRAAIEAGLGRGATSLDGLARALNERGVGSPEGKAWYKTTVRAYLLQSSTLDLDEEAAWRQEVFRRVVPKVLKAGALIRLKLSNCAKAGVAKQHALPCAPLHWSVVGG